MYNLQVNTRNNRYKYDGKSENDVIIYFPWNASESMPYLYANIA